MYGSIHERGLLETIFLLGFSLRASSSQQDRLQDVGEVLVTLTDFEGSPSGRSCANVLIGSTISSAETLPACPKAINKLARALCRFPIRSATCEDHDKSGTDRSAVAERTKNHKNDSEDPSTAVTTNDWMTVRVV